MSETGEISWEPNKVAYNADAYHPGKVVTHDEFNALFLANVAQGNTLTNTLKEFFEQFKSVLDTRDENTTEAYTKLIQDKLSELIGSAPDSLDTLKEIADALNNDADLATNLANQVSEKLSKTGDTMTGPLEIKTASAEAISLTRKQDDQTIKTFIGALADGIIQMVSTQGHGIIARQDGLYEKTAEGIARVYSANNPPPIDVEIETTPDVTVDDSRAVTSDGVYKYVEAKIGTIYEIVSKI